MPRQIPQTPQPQPSPDALNPDRLPCIGFTRLRLTWLVAKLKRYYAIIRFPECHLSSSLILLLGHTRHATTGCRRRAKNFQGLTGCLTDGCLKTVVLLSRRYVTRMGRRLLDSSRDLPITRREVLPSGMNRPWAVSNRNKISELHPFIAAGPPTVNSSSQPFCVRFKTNLQLMMPTTALQHSIPGLWLTVTRTGFSPASQSDLASSHVHRFVIPRHVRG